MLSKAGTMLLGLINETPLNAYEITKKLQFMNVKQWYDIADSTVYTTIKTLEKKELIFGKIEKNGNMPDRTMYSITDMGKSELLNTIQYSFLHFDYDIKLFSIAAFFIDIFPLSEKNKLLSARLEMLKKYLIGLEEQIKNMTSMDLPKLSVANVKRVRGIVNAELLGTEELLFACETE